MPTEKDQVEAREEKSPEPPEPSPRGNVHSEPDDGDPGELPSPLPN